MVKGPNVTVLSWQTIYDYAIKTAEKIKSSGYHPDAIIGVTRGGWVHARTQCDFLGVKDLYAVKVEHWGVTAQPDGSARLTVPIDARYIQGKKVLVIDDVTDTGKSLMTVVDHLKSLKTVTDIKTATLLHIRGAAFTPDFYGEEVNWAWFTFPWNYYEDFTNLVMELFKNEKTTSLSASQIIKLLEAYNGIKITEKELAPLHTHMVWLGKLKAASGNSWQRK